MSQLFHQSTNTIAKASIFGALLFFAALLWIIAGIDRSPYMTQVNVVRDQPLPFSHEHHVRGLGIDCRYCHTSVEQSAFAGMPSAKTCMNCHSAVWAQSPVLQPLRDSAATGEPIRWTRVHDLPDFVYFDHSIHVKKGIGCVTCHGQIDRMPLTSRQVSLHMDWCLQCHRQPERFVRPREEVFNTDWQPPSNQTALGRRLVTQYNIQRRTDCTVCHR